MEKEVLNFEEEIKLTLPIQFLKECYYEKNFVGVDEKRQILQTKDQVEQLIYKAQHILSVINRIEIKLL